MSEKHGKGRVEMKRFWFGVYQKNPLFHADQDCSYLENNVVRDLQDMPVAHIPMDSNQVGSESNLRFCDRCVGGAPFWEK